MSGYSELKQDAQDQIDGHEITCDPETVLALIAENDRLQEAHEQICTNYNQVSYASEERGKQIDQLKAELEHTGYDHDLLRSERDQLKAENEALVSALNDILRVTPMDVEAFGIAALVLGELSGAAMGKGDKG